MGLRNNGDLASYFDKSAAVVRQCSDRLERTYGKPTLEYSRGSFQTRPVFSTFVAILGVLSLLPLITFICSSLFVVFSVLFFALSCALAVIVLMEIILVSLLLGTLIGALALATCLTSMTTSVYLVARLVALLRTESGITGLAKWVDEIRSWAFGPGEKGVPSQRQKDRARTDERNKGAGSSEESAVVVKHEGESDESLLHDSGEEREDIGKSAD